MHQSILTQDSHNITSKADTYQTTSKTNHGRGLYLPVELAVSPRTRSLTQIYRQDRSVSNGNRTLCVKIHGAGKQHLL